jgi:GNAT superfamily N-acetyltransferase
MKAAEDVRIRPAVAGDRPWIERHLTRSWGSTIVVTRGVAHDAARLPALLAERGEDIVGVATYRLADTECELVSLDALRQGQGIGSALLTRVREEAVRRG